ncbi:acylphosphatase [Methanolobus psychrophilus R15]|nr:acylphosphatase [Methanolobus psychrophilus R15]
MQDKNTNAEALTSATVIACGKVQGVYYRKFAQENAIRLGLAGFARNLSDGRVEIVAEGSRAAIEELISLLHEGPAFADVAGLDILWSSPSGEFPDFRIKR